MKKFAAIIMVALSFSTAAVSATECAVEFQQAEQAVRERYINGMSGLASSNFSTRPGTFSSMACLDKFMQGDMDIFFRPPDLDSLLQQALSFACETVMDAVQGGGGGGGGSTDVLAMLKSMGGGVKLPSSLGNGIKLPAAGGSGIDIQSLFGGMK